MPTISEFFGILILMYYNDHEKELLEDWNYAANKKKLQKIPPLH